MENILSVLPPSVLGTAFSCALLLLVYGCPVAYAQDGFQPGSIEHLSRTAEQGGGTTEGQEPAPLSDQMEISPQERIAIYFVEQGQVALSQEDFEQARIFFERAIETAPLQPYGYYFLGRLAFTLGEADQALVFLLRAELLFSEKNADWLGTITCLQGAIHEAAGDYEDARLDYQRCLAFSPQSLRAISALARLPDEGER